MPIKEPGSLATGIYRRLTVYAIIVAGGFLLSKVLGLGREVLIARAFGTAGSLDAYYAAFNFPDLLFALIPGGALASVFIPVLSTYFEREGEEGGWKFASIVVNDVFITVALLSALGIGFSHPLVAFVIAPGFDPQRQALTAAPREIPAEVSSELEAHVVARHRLQLREAIIADLSAISLMTPIVLWMGITTFDYHGDFPSIHHCG